MEQNFIAYYIEDPSIETLSDLVDSSPLFKKYQGGKWQKLADEECYGQTNRELIESMYIPDENSWPDIVNGTTIYIPSDNVTKDFASIESEGQVVEFHKLDSFFTKVQKELEEEREKGKYVPVELMDLNLKEKVYQVNSFIRVWVYSKALGEIYDLTDFIFSVQTQTNLSGGDSFSIRLPYISSDSDKLNPVGYGVEQSVYTTDVFRQISYFQKNIGENDIVFISFETLKSEAERRKERNYTLSDFIVSKNDLCNQYYDFIGLISNVQQTSNMQGGGEVSISGSSLDKLFVDDEAIFRPISVIENASYGTLLLGGRTKRGWMQRQFADSRYHRFLTFQYRTIENTLKFILNLISNVGFMPLSDSGSDNTDLFSSYGNERSYLYAVQDVNGAETISKTLAKGIYQIVKLVIDERVSDRKLSDSNISNPQGSILNLMKQTCQPNLVEFITDTYKNTFDIICRVPPFTQKGIAGYKDKMIEISADMVMSENLGWERNFYTWFEFIPKGNIVPVGQGENTTLCYIPVVYLTSYIDLWGCKQFSAISPYGIGNVDLEMEQTVQDACFILESNFYLPFTRRGSITLCVPDRRIRKGMWIKYAKTGEIFYVESVSQDVSVSSGNISRQTTLAVSRGLVEKYVFTNQKDGYFDIMDFDEIAKQIKGIRNNKKVTFEPIIDKALFDFFVKRKQFDNE